MKKRIVAIGSIMAVVAVGGQLEGAESPVTSCVDAVRPMIGTDGTGHVFPGACVPFGMVQLSPDTRTTEWKGCSGYHYSDPDILGFSHNHLSGTGCPDLGNIMLMPTVGPVRLHPGKTPSDGYRARFSHDQETASPGYYRVVLPDAGITVELTATARAGLHRYTFPGSDQAHVIVDLVHGIGHSNPIECILTAENDHILSGSRRYIGWGGTRTFYFVAEFSKPFRGMGIECNGKLIEGRHAQGKQVRAHVDFTTQAGEQILVKVGLSAVSVAGARKNLAEIPGFDFEKTHQAARQAWEEQLGRVQADFADTATRETFYTALYHAAIHPNLFNDADGAFFGPDGQTHSAPGFNYYTTLSLWDTFRAEHPLLDLVAPERINDLVNTMLTHYQLMEPHVLPVWVNAGQETWCMIAYHSIPVIAEAYAKGFRGFDANAALDAMVTTMQRESNTLSRGFIPAVPGGERDRTHDKMQSVARLVELSYDDSCVARFGAALGRSTAVKETAARARLWKNVFDPSTGFLRGRTADGKFVTPFNPRFIDFENYTEANAWHYSFFVPQDVPGLIAAMGGDEAFVNKLETMFESSSDMPVMWLDVTGLLGQYAHGNEPCHHVAYLYNYAGAAWKTQERIRHIMTALYTNTVDGLCGNDDCGQMSAWYVWSAAGMYPVDPMSGVYVIGSPLAARVAFHLNGGKTFTIIARHNSATNKYIQSAKLNGRTLQRSWIVHDELMAGGELVFVMGPTPNKEWGKAPANRPPSPVWK